MCNIRYIHILKWTDVKLYIGIHLNYIADHFNRWNFKYGRRAVLQIYQS